MSEQYYTQEENLPNTPEQALQNWEAQSNSLASIVPEVADRINQAGTMLGELYAQAEAQGNQQAMINISELWVNTQTLGTQTVQLDAARQAAAVAIQTIEEDRRRVLELYGELESAINEGDEHHPQLKDFADAIRSDEAEYQQEYAMEEAQEYALEYAHEITFDNLSENLQEITGCNWHKVQRFIAIMQGDYQISDVNKALLKEIIESLEVEREGEGS